MASTVGFPVDGTRTFIASVKAAGGIHLVAVESGEIIGWCDIVRNSFEGMRHTGRLGMGIRKERRSRGVGRAILETAVEQAFASGIDRVELEVFAPNTSAVKLYESYGFRHECRKVGGQKLDGISDDILLYAKHQKA